MCMTDDWNYSTHIARALGEIERRTHVRVLHAHMRRHIRLLHRPRQYYVHICNDISNLGLVHARKLSVWVCVLACLGAGRQQRGRPRAQSDRKHSFGRHVLVGSFVRSFATRCRARARELSRENYVVLIECVMFGRVECSMLQRLSLIDRRRFIGRHNTHIAYTTWCIHSYDFCGFYVGGSRKGKLKGRPQLHTMRHLQIRGGHIHILYVVRFYYDNRNGWEAYFYWGSRARVAAVQTWPYFYYRQNNCIRLFIINWVSNYVVSVYAGTDFLYVAIIIETLFCLFDDLLSMSIVFRRYTQIEHKLASSPQHTVELLFH